MEKMSNTLMVTITSFLMHHYDEAMYIILDTSSMNEISLHKYLIMAGSSFQGALFVRFLVAISAE